MPQIVEPRASVLDDASDREPAKYGEKFKSNLNGGFFVSQETQN